MARELKPCGTAAAARRHYRNNEPLCVECQQAVRDQKNERDRAKRDAEFAAFHESLSDIELPDEVAGDDVDPLAEALDSLRLVRRALHSDQTMPKDISALSRRRDELVDRVARLKGQQIQTTAVTEIDKIRERYHRRRRAAM